MSHASGFLALLNPHNRERAMKKAENDSTKFTELQDVKI
jgi:hypothetical protein